MRLRGARSFSNWKLGRDFFKYKGHYFPKCFFLGGNYTNRYMTFIKSSKLRENWPIVISDEGAKRFFQIENGGGRTFYALRNILDILSYCFLFLKRGNGVKDREFKLIGGGQRVKFLSKSYFSTRVFYKNCCWWLMEAGSFIRTNVVFVTVICMRHVGSSKWVFLLVFYGALMCVLMGYFSLLIYHHLMFLNLMTSAYAYGF